MFGGADAYDRHDQNKFWLRANHSSYDPQLKLTERPSSEESEDEPFCYAFSDAKPVFLTTDYTCPDRFYCPNITQGDPSTKPQMCPPSLECMRLRLQLTYCDPQGRYEPIICPKSMYCPTPDTLLPCPEHHYCPWGTQVPIPCGWGAKCPEGSHKNTVWLGLLACGLIDGVMLIIYCALHIRRKMLSRGRSMATLLPSFTSSNPTSPAEAPVPTPSRSVYRRSSQPVIVLPAEQTEKALSTWQFVLGNIRWFLHPRAQKAPPRRGKTVASSLSTLRVKTKIDALSEDPDVTPAFEDGQPHPDLVQGFRDAMQGNPLQLNIRFHKLGLMVKEKKHILHDVTGHITPGRVTVIMGPSGAGKVASFFVLGSLERRSLKERG